MTAEDEAARLEQRVRRLEQELRDLQARNRGLAEIVRSHERSMQNIRHQVRRLDPDWGGIGGGLDPQDQKPWVCNDHRIVTATSPGQQPVSYCRECGRDEQGNVIVQPWRLRQRSPEYLQIHLEP